MKTLFFSVFVFALILTPIHGQDDPLRVVTSTTIIADVAAQVGGEQVEVNSLVPIGADTHTFVLSPRDLLTVSRADLVLVNGMRLETGLLDVLTTNSQSPPLVVSLGITVRTNSDNVSETEVLGILGQDLDCDDPLVTLVQDPEDEDTHDEDPEGDHDHGPCDPHVWMDVANVMIWTRNIAQALAAADPVHADVYEANVVAYLGELAALEVELQDIVDTLPPENRLLVTNHEFLGYFAAAHDFTVIGTITPGISSAAEINPQELARLVTVVRNAGVPAIFAETSDNTRLADTLADEVGGVQVVELFSGSLSDADGPASTYLDYMRYNVMTIVSALKK